MEPLWVDVTLVLIVHDEQLAEHGGCEGVRDRGALESALAGPRNLLGYAKSPPTLTQLGAVYAAGIAQNHPFTDGNKRTALVVCLTFLKLNGVAMSADPGTRYVMFDGLASGSISEKAFAKWLQDFTERIKKLPKAAE